MNKNIIKIISIKDPRNQTTLDFRYFYQDSYSLLDGIIHPLQDFPFEPSETSMEKSKVRWHEGNRGGILKTLVKMHYFSKTSKRCPVRRVSFIVVYINLPRSLVHKFRPLYSSCTTTVDSGILELNLIPSTYIEALSFIFVQLSRHAGSRGVRASLGSRGCL